MTIPSHTHTQSNQSFTQHCGNKDTLKYTHTTHSVGNRKHTLHTRNEKQQQTRRTRKECLGGPRAACSSIVTALSPVAANGPVPAAAVPGPGTAPGRPAALSPVDFATSDISVNKFNTDFGADNSRLSRVHWSQNVQPCMNFIVWKVPVKPGSGTHGGLLRCAPSSPAQSTTQCAS